jgi:hypothetical protein
MLRERKPNEDCPTILDSHWVALTLKDRNLHMDSGKKSLIMKWRMLFLKELTLNNSKQG